MSFIQLKKKALYDKAIPTDYADISEIFYCLGLISKAASYDAKMNNTMEPERTCTI